MDDKTPAYWRSLGTVAAVIMLLGFIPIWTVRAGGCKTERMVPTAICTVDGRPVACEQIGQSSNPQKEVVTDIRPVFLGLLLMLCGCVLGAYSGSHLRRIRNELMIGPTKKCKRKRANQPCCPPLKFAVRPAAR